MATINIHIRPLQADGDSYVFEAIQESLADVSRWMADLNTNLTLADVRGYIEAQPQQQAERRAYNFAIVDDRQDLILGGCGLTQFNWQHRLANLYYWVRSSQVGQGIASTATGLLANFGFETLGLQRVELVIAVDNVASLRVAEKVGVRCEGRLRNRLYIDGRIDEAFMYSLIPTDWPNRMNTH